MAANDSTQYTGHIFWNESTFSDYISIDDDASVPGDGLECLRIIVSVVYCLVCAVGLTGNVLVMHLVRARARQQISTINVFVFNLALTDFQFALTLPIWAVDAAMDFSWPFGGAMCKIVLTITVLNVYTNVFLLTAMSVTRYWSVASAISQKSRLSARAAKLISLVLWLVAAAATAPTTIFANVKDVAGEQLCLLKFPKNKWLAVYHLQKIILAFLIPLTVISVSYLLLLRFLKQHYVNTSNPNRQTKIANSVKLLVLVFFVCWFPHHMATFWGVLVKLEVVSWTDTYYFFHTYVFPVTACLAHCNSCLNPVIYCLMRKEFRKTLKSTFWHIHTSLAPYMPPYGQKAREGDMLMSAPLDPGICQGCPHHFSQTGSKCHCLASTTMTTLPDAKDPGQSNDHQESDSCQRSLFEGSAA
ncbi:relaxin-3 receptor 2 [Ambystoma mexicanum]|uniref:relaxin-3 receptor 2 n=1 Tax=Ambystoma mexicanum TaxID=8296 RepID=UPI0037E99F2F